MGGVTDSQTVLRSLKSVFSGNNKRKGKPVIFTLFTTFTPIILLLIAGLVFWQRMENEHISCHAPPEEDIRVAAVNQYCFITGTYTVVDYPKKLKGLQKNLPYPGIGQHIPSSSPTGGTKVKYHMYFQWVPFILLIQAILFAVPDLMWKSLRKDTLSRYCDCITSENDKDNSSNNNIKLTARRFLINLKHHSSFSGWLLTTEVLNLCMVMLAILLSDLLLTGEFFYLGRDWINYLKTDHPDEVSMKEQNLSTNPLDLTFPKMSKCEFKKFGPGGSIINYDLLCVMTLNVFHDKIFLFLWFWFLLLMVIQSFNLIYQLIIFRSKVYQYREIFGRIDAAFLDDENAKYLDKHPAFREKAKSFLCSLGYSDWFLLRAIATSIDIRLFTEFFQYLIKQQEEQQYRKKYDQQNHDSIVNKAKYPRNEDGVGVGGLMRWKNQNHYNENLVGTFDHQNESKNLTRNRMQSQSLYSPLNQSLREMHQQQMEEGTALINPDFKKNINTHAPVVVPKPPPFQQTVQQSTVDIPDSGQESDRNYNENARDNFSEA